MTIILGPVGITKMDIHCHVIVLICSCFQLVKTDAEVFVHFESYDNPAGTTNLGRCCDKFTILCDHGCDYYFRVCLDDTRSPTNVKICKYGQYKTELAFENQRSVVLGDIIGGVANPFYFKIPGTINKMVKLKVSIKDRDHFSRNDLVDYLKSNIWLYKGIFEEIQIPLDLTGHTSLHTVVTLRCAENWYGEDCGTYCRPPGNEEHFECDKLTGKQVCQQGWLGTSCNMHAVGQDPER